MFSQKDPQIVNKFAIDSENLLQHEQHIYTVEKNLTSHWVSKDTAPKISTRPMQSLTIDLLCLLSVRKSNAPVTGRSLWRLVCVSMSGDLLFVGLGIL